MSADPVVHLGGSRVLFRGALAGDIPFILDSWMSSYRQSYHVRGVEGPVYYREQRRVCETLLLRASTLVACDPESPSTIWGWAVAEEVDESLVLHFVYVRGGFQDLGIGSHLVATFLRASNAVSLVYTHQTKAGRKWAEKMSEALPMTPHNGRMPAVYNPWLLYRTLGAGWANG